MLLVCIGVTAWESAYVKSTAKAIVERLNDPTNGMGVFNNEFEVTTHSGTNMLHAKIAEVTRRQEKEVAELKRKVLGSTDDVFDPMLDLNAKVPSETFRAVEGALEGGVK